MSEFLAEARVLVLPDTSQFETRLRAELQAAVAKPLTIPVVAAAATGTAAAVTAQLAAAQQTAAAATAQLTGLAKIENTTFAKQAVILEATAVATEQVAGAQAALAATASKSRATLLGAGSASARLDAALLGLRTAAGSAAVIGLGALALGAIAAGKAIRTSVGNFVSFQRELATFQVVASASADDMERVAAAATRLGSDVRLPAVTAADAAEAMTLLAKAGLSVEDSIAGAEGVLQLATAAQISNADAAQLAASALNAFGLAGEDATRVADDFANAANAAQGSISDIALALNQASAVARQVGLSLEDTTAILSLLAKNGVQGSDAGTALRTALIRLIAPSKQAATEIQKLGLQIRDAQGNVRADVFAQFGEVTRNLSPAARDAAAALIFGQDAIRAVAIGAREGVDGLQLMQYQIDQTGTAAEVAAARTTGLGGSFAGLTSGLETLSLSVGKLLSVGLKPYVDVLSSVVEGTNKAAEAIEGLATAALNAETPLGKVKDRLLDIASITVPLVGPIRLVKEGLERFGVGVDEQAQRVRDLEDALQQLQKARVAAQEGGQATIAKQLTADIEELRAQINNLKKDGDGIPDSLTDHLRDAADRLRAVRDSRIKLDIDVSGLDKLIADLEKQIPITQQVEGNINRLRDDYLDLADAAVKSASATDILNKALRDLARQSSALQAELLKLQTEGGTPAQQIGVLQADIDTQRQIIEDAKKRGGVGTATTIKNAREQILRDQAEIDSITRQIEADQKKAADDAEKAAKKAQDERDRQFEALADLFGGRQQNIRDALSRAGITGNLQKEIRLNRSLIDALKKERAVLQDRLKTLNVSVDTRRQVFAAIDRALEQAQQDALRFQLEQKRRLEEAVNTRLDLKIQLAEIRDNVPAQIKARTEKLNALNRELKALQKAHKGNTVEALQLKVQIAQEQAALDELAKQTKARNTAFAQATFEFLQSQQGFAANLLGNLIPTGLTGGLVGGGQASPAAPVAAAVLPVAGAAEARSQTGPTAGQGNTTNHLLNLILQQLKELNGEQKAPEATRQRRQSFSIMDGAGGIGGV